MKIALIFLFLLSAFLSFGQNIDTTEYKILIKPKTQPSYIFVMDTTRIMVDSIPIDDIKPKWLRKIEVLKDEDAKTLYGNQYGIIIIYPKKRFYNRITSVLD